MVLSRVNRDASREEVPGRIVVRVPFGTHFAAPADPGAAASAPPRVLVVGNDRHRDWNLLAEVTARVPEADFDIISLSEEARAQSWPANVALRSTTQSQVLAAYARSSLVALPLRHNRHASGCTVAIEAISAGIPLVVSDAGGIDEYVAGSDAALVPVGDAAAFADAIREGLARQGARRTGGTTTASERGLSEADYIARMALLTQSALSRSAMDSAVEAFAPVPEPVSRARGGDRLNTLDVMIGAQRLRDLLFSKLAAPGFGAFGKNSRILLPTRLSGAEHMSVGDGVLIGAGSWLIVPEQRAPGPNIVIHDRVRMNTTSVSAVSRVELEEGVAIARGCYISDHSHGFDDPQTPIRYQSITRVAPVLIRRGAWLGQNCVVMPGVTIGRGSVVGANSVVLHDVPDRTIVAGVPARVIRELP